MISRLKNRITFQSKIEESDGAGGQILTDVDYYTCWAEIFRENQNKTNIAGKDSLSDSIVFRIRDAESISISNDLTIAYDGNIYLISSVIDEMDMKNYLRITCATLRRVDTWDSITAFWENISKTWETV
jgi:SPP1 family predicted phage head-tail adaptor